MNTPLAISPLIAHIPHAVPVVIVWGIMLRFYLVQRKPKVERVPTAEISGERTSAVPPAGRRVWAADDEPGTSVSSRYQGVPVVGRRSAGRH